MERFLRWSTGCYRYPWVVLMISAGVTMFLAAGIPGVKFDNDLRSMIPSDDHELMISDYYEDEDLFGRSAADFIGVESPDAFSVSSLSYLRVLKEQIDRVNESLPVQSVAALLRVSPEDAVVLIGQLRSLGINQTSLAEFLPVAREAARAQREWGWQPGTAERLAKAVSRVDPGRLFRVSEPPIRSVQSLLDADYVVNREDALVTEKILPGNRAITPETAREVKSRAESWSLYQDTLYSRDGTLANVVVNVANGDMAVISSVATALKTILADHPSPGIRTYLDGEGVISREMGVTMLSDLTILMPLVVVTVGVILFLCFRKWQGLVYPMVVVAVSVVCAVGAMGWLGVPFNIASVAMPPLLVAIASAYGIHQMNHYFLDPDHDKLTILAHNIGVVGLAILLSGVTVMVGFGALAAERFVPIRNFGLFTAFGDLVAIAVALWTLPALLLVGSHTKNVTTQESESGLLGRFLRSLVGLNQRHAKTVVIAAAVLSAAFLLGFLGIRSELNNISFFKTSTEIRKADDLLNEKLAGTQSLQVVLDTNLSSPVIGPSGRLESAPDGEPVMAVTPAILQKIEAFSRDVQAKFPRVRKVMSLNDVVKKMNQEMNGGNPSFFVVPGDPNLIAQYLLIFSGDLQSVLTAGHDKLRISLTMKRMGTEDAEQIARWVRAYFDPEFCRANHVRAEVTGVAHLYYTANELLLDGMVKSIVICVVLVFFILFGLLRNFKMSLIAVSPILATLVINFGLLGFLQIPLNTATAMVSSIAVGIGVDYSIHFITWYRKQVRRSRDVAAALEHSILHKGRAILYNMLVIFGGFVVLVASNFVPLVQFGLLVAICMVTTAAGALIVVPAILRLLSKRERAYLFLDRPATTRIEE